MAQDGLWNVEAAGGFSAEIGEFRLVVQALKGMGGDVRFLVLRQSTGPILVGSGVKEGWRAAMVAAEQMVERCSTLALAPKLKST